MRVAQRYSGLAKLCKLKIDRKNLRQATDSMTDAVCESYDRVADEYTSRIFHELQHKPLDRQLLNRLAAEVPGRGEVIKSFTNRSYGDVLFRWTSFSFRFGKFETS
jgi:hypothetical protein